MPRFALSPPRAANLSQEYVEWLHYRNAGSPKVAGIGGERMFSRHLGVTGMLRFLIVAGADKTRTAFQLLAGLLLRI